MKKIIVILFALILITGCNSNTQYDLENYNKALGEISNSHFSEALVLLKKSINKNPGHTESYLEAGNILIQKEAYDDAVELLEGGVNFVENESELLNRIGDVYFLMNQYDKAEEYFRASIKKDPSNNMALHGLISSLGRQEKFDDLEKTFSSNDSSIENIKLAEVFYYAKDKEKAISLLDETRDNMDEDRYNYIKNTINSDSSDFVRKMELSRLIINEGYPSLAIPLLDEVIKSNEFYEGGYLFKGLIYYLIGKYDQSEELLKKAVQLNPDFAESYRHLANLYALKGNFEKANNNYQKSIIIEENEMILSDYFEFLRYHPEFEGVYDIGNKLLTTTQSEFIRYQLDEIRCIRQENLSEINASLDKYTEIDSSTKETLRLCTTLFANTDQSANELREVIAKNSENLLAHYLLIEIYERDEDEQLTQTKNSLLDKDTNGFFSYILNY